MKTKKAFLAFEILIISIITSLFMAVILKTTSPLSSTIGADSGIFLTIGKSIAEGNLLYVDIFDHKGPLLFFLNALPQVFIDGTLGVWILQTIFVIITVILIVKIGDILLKNNMKYIAPLFYILYIGFTFEGGNLSEEYSNLFCIIGLYIFVKYYISGFKFKKRYPLILGICFMAITLIRINNAAILVSIVLTVIIIIAMRKEFKLIGTSIMNFILGCLTVFLPVSLYFLIQDAIYDFIYASFLYNFKYKGDGIVTNIAKIVDYSDKFKNIIFFIVLISIINAIVLIIKSKYELCIFVVINLLVTIVAIAAGGKGYLHYTTLGSIGFIFNIILAFKYWHIMRYNFVKVVVISAILFKVGTFTINTYEKVKGEVVAENIYKQSVIELSSNVGKEERILGYNIPAKWYYTANLLPDNKYFTLQDWWASFDQSINESINDYLNSDAPDWIVTSDINDIKNEFVKEVINDEYILIDENLSGKLYKKK
ncbi:hypothetical protein [Clostridium sp.]|uniref:hypothetical protein n=1 Tax=Clostridium sp. TaxID=1506 RepID=UPI003F3D36DC